MHILQIYKDYHPILGGIENHVRDLSEGLVARGHRVTILVTSLTNETQIERPHPGLTVIKSARALHLASTPLSPAMLRHARAQHPDIVHLHFPYPPGDLAARVVPGHPPLVVTYHSDIVRQRNLLRVYGPLLEATLRRAARILPTSPNYLASSPFLRRHAAKCAVVPLGIDTQRFTQVDEAKVAEVRGRYNAWGLGSGVWGLGSRIKGSELGIESWRSGTENPHEHSGSQFSVLGSNQPPLVVFVGRLRYYKGLHVLLDAMPGVRGRLLIGGTGPERDALETQAARLGIADRVDFLGDVPDDELAPLLHAADVFVLPAHLRAEALGLSQLEALAAGTPCVSTELGTGTSFANRHGETGLVVPPNNHAALASALNTLLDNPELRKQYGAAGQRRVAALFSQSRMLDAVENVYAEVATR